MIYKCKDTCGQTHNKESHFLPKIILGIIPHIAAESDIIKLNEIIFVWLLLAATVLTF